MSDPIEYKFAHAALPSAALSTRLLARWRRGKWLTRVKVLAGGAVVGALIAVASAMFDIPFWAGLLIGLGPTVLYVAMTQTHLRLTMARLAREQASTPWRAGDTEVRLDGHGITLTHPSGVSTIRWPAVIDLAEEEAHLLLMLSPLEYVPVPQDAIAPLTFDEAAERIESWRSAAAPPPVSEADA